MSTAARKQITSASARLNSAPTESAKILQFGHSYACAREKLPTAAERRDAIKRAIIQVLSRGLSVSAACRAGNVSRDTFYRWRRADHKFAADIADAELAGIDALEDVLVQAAPKDWRAARALLIAKRPEVWGRGARSDRKPAATQATEAGARAATYRAAMAQLGIDAGVAGCGAGKNTVDGVEIKFQQAEMRAPGSCG